MTGIALSVVGLALASEPASLQAAGESVWTEGRAGAVVKVYGDVGPFRYGVMANRGQLPHTTRLDALVGLSTSPSSWIRITAGIQPGLLLPDVPCTRRCRDWDDFGPGNRRLVGFGRLTLAVESYPTPRTTIEVLWQTLHFPRRIRYWNAEQYPPIGLLVYAVLESSMMVQHALVQRGGLRLDILAEARGLGWLVIGPFGGVHESAFGPRVGGGLALGPGIGVVSAVEVTAGTSASGPYLSAGIRMGPRRENTMW